MKISTLFLWICLLAIPAIAEKNNGQIERVKPGTYQISYSNQTIDVFFNYLPTNGLEHFFVEPDLVEIEKYEIVAMIKEQIDQLPEAFINDFLDIDLFPLTIQNRNEFGYTFDKQLVIEVSKIREGMSFANSVKLSLVHEFGHLVEENLNIIQAAMDFKNYLRVIQQSYDSPDEAKGNNIYEQGYVSRYASGELTNHYNASEEFAELLAHLVYRESRHDVLDYIEHHPKSKLSLKVTRFIDFLDNNISYLGTEYIFSDIEKSEQSTLTDDHKDGELLLAAHELRSYQSYNFSATEDNDEELLANSNEDLPINNQPFNDWEKVENESSWTVDEHAFPPQSFIIEEDSNQNRKKKKSGKVKKRKGTGLLITGAAIYVLLQLLK